MVRRWHSISIASRKSRRRRPRRRKASPSATETARWSRLADVGCDPIFDARPLKRLIQQQISNELSLHPSSG
ncbi:MAG TPA: hypothetical protein VEK15_23440 [Vicinamibacteria bacterium]|nr:hypothetical protein [Vicinamibacteria bacterium]